MQLAILIAVICTLAQSEASDRAVGCANWRLGLTLASASLTPLLAFFGSLALARRMSAVPASLASLDRQFERLQGLTVFVWLALVAATMYLIEWPCLVRSDWSLGRLPLIDELVLLAPVVAPLLLIWCAFYHVEWTTQRIIAAAYGRPRPCYRLGSYLWLHVRHHLGLVLLPTLLVIGLSEAARLAWPSTSADDAWWIYLPLLAAMVVLMPLAVKRVWKTVPLAEGSLRKRLLTVCRQRRIGIREILVWQTGGQMANAAVAGVVPGLRYVFLTDGLLARLNDEEVQAVLRHELGHVVGQHLPLRLLVLGLPLVAWLAFKQSFPTAADEIKAALVGLEIPLAWHALLMPAALAAYAVVVVGRYSRLLEHDADLAACRDGDGSISPTFVGVFSSALCTVTPPGRESRLAQWLHPRLESRLAFLGRMAAEPVSCQMFQLRLKAIAWSVGAVYLGAAAMLASSELHRPRVDAVMSSAPAEQSTQAEQIRQNTAASAASAR